jgi:hypothetical protein
VASPFSPFGAAVGGTSRAVYLEKIGAFKAGVREPRTWQHGMTEEGSGFAFRRFLLPEYMIDRDGRGRSHRVVRGEILGPTRDVRRRRRSARTSSLIKNESRGIEERSSGPSLPERGRLVPVTRGDTVKLREPPKAPTTKHGRKRTVWPG